MCNPLAVVMAVSAVASAGQSAYQSNKADKLASRQEEERKTQLRQQANTRTNSESGLFDVSTENTGGSDLGLGNTFLTGSQGVSNNQLNLGGGNTRLGG